MISFGRSLRTLVSRALTTVERGARSIPLVSSRDPARASRRTRRCQPNSETLEPLQLLTSIASAAVYDATIATYTLFGTVSVNVVGVPTFDYRSLQIGYPQDNNVPVSASMSNKGAITAVIYDMTNATFTIYGQVNDANGKPFNTYETVQIGYSQDNLKPVSASLASNGGVTALLYDMTNATFTSYVPTGFDPTGKILYSYHDVQVGIPGHTMTMVSASVNSAGGITGIAYDSTTATFYASVPIGIDSKKNPIYVFTQLQMGYPQDQLKPLAAAVNTGGITSALIYDFTNATYTCVRTSRPRGLRVFKSSDRLSSGPARPDLGFDRLDRQHHLRRRLRLDHRDIYHLRPRERRHLRQDHQRIQEPPDRLPARQAHADRRLRRRQRNLDRDRLRRDQRDLHPFWPGFLRHIQSTDIRIQNPHDRLPGQQAHPAPLCDRHQMTGCPKTIRKRNDPRPRCGRGSLFLGRGGFSPVTQPVVLKLTGTPLMMTPLRATRLARAVGVLESS